MIKPVYVFSLFLLCAGATVAGSHLNSLKFATIAFPGARITEATGINGHGHVVGVWEDAVTGLSQGFILRDGVYRPFAVPGARNTYPQGINDAGVIVGAFDVTAQEGETCCESHGFIWTPAGGYSTVTFPGVTDFPVTWLSGINNDGQIVGGYSEFDVTIVDTRGIHGFLLINGVFTVIDFPMAPPFPTTPVTYATGINDNGDIVGGYNDLDTRRGYLLTGGIFSPFDVPGAFMTDLFGINAAGDIVGEYLEARGATSFLYTPRKGIHAITLSGGAKRQFSFLLARTINGSGQIVGTYTENQLGGSLHASGRLSLSRLRGYAPAERGRQSDAGSDPGALRGFVASPPPRR